MTSTSPRLLWVTPTGCKEKKYKSVCVQKAKNNSQAALLVPLENFPPDYENPRNH